MDALEIIPIFNLKKSTLRLDSKHITSIQSWRMMMTVRTMTTTTTTTTTNKCAPRIFYWRREVI